MTIADKMIREGLSKEKEGREHVEMQQEFWAEGPARAEGLDSQRSWCLMNSKMVAWMVTCPGMGWADGWSLCFCFNLF